MITASQAKKYAEEATRARLADVENRAKDWVMAHVAPAVEESAKKGYSFVTIPVQGMMPSMKVFINDILHDGGYTYTWNKMNSVIVRWM